MSNFNDLKSKALSDPDTLAEYEKLKPTFDFYKHTALRTETDKLLHEIVYTVYQGEFLLMFWTANCNWSKDPKDAVPRINDGTLLDIFLIGHPVFLISAEGFEKVYLNK